MRSLRLVAAGLAVGFVFAAALTRLMASLLFHVTPNDPRTFALVVGVLVVVSVAAAYLPARRAANVDPIVALRSL